MSEIYRPQRILSYVVQSDNGLAPNIAGDFCTLSVCKPVVRASAQVGEDWIVGLSTARHGRNRVIYAMQAEEKVPFASYFEDPRFQIKKPTMSYKGDNFFEDRGQGLSIAFEEAAHFGKDTAIARDLKAPFAVAAKNFWYFGENAPELPQELHARKIALPGIGRQGHRITNEVHDIEPLHKWLSSIKTGIHGQPRDLAVQAIS